MVHDIQHIVPVDAWQLSENVLRGDVKGALGLCFIDADLVLRDNECVSGS